MVKQMEEEVELPQIESRLRLNEPEHPHTTSKAALDAFKSNAALRSCYENRLKLWNSILEERCFSCVILAMPYHRFPARSLFQFMFVIGPDKKNCVGL